MALKEEYYLRPYSKSLFIKTIITSILIFSLTSCNNNITNINNSDSREISVHKHQDINSFSNILILNSNSPAIVKLDEFTPAVKTDTNAFQIKHFGGFKHNLKKHKDIQIDNITLDTGERVMDEGSPATGEIKPDYAGKVINLNIIGKFNTAPKMKLENMLFTNEPGLIHQSVVEQEPPIRVTLDDMILFTPVSASSTAITVTLDSKGISDLYLKGDHKLTITAGKYFSDTLVKVGEPAPVTSLTPKIDSVEILKDKEGKPVNLKVTGSNLMLNYRFSYSQVDGTFSFGHENSVIDNNGTLKWESIIHLPNPKTFAPSGQHTISLATPFGFSFHSFSN